MNFIEEKANLIYSRVSSVIERNRHSDIFNKVFLRPIEIALKTRLTERSETKHKDALPYGLKQVVKKDIEDNYYHLCDFGSFQALNDNQLSIDYIEQNNYDNLVSLIKPKDKEGKLQLCICICMYSEDKSMLKKTLQGVAQNISVFHQHGISSDQIAVVVIMDGIEKIHPSVIDFFEEEERLSNIYLEDKIEQITPQDISRENFDFQEVDEEEIININTFLFDKEELRDRKKRRFQARKKEYEEVKRMIGRIDTLLNDKKVTFNDLDEFLHRFFNTKAIENFKKEFSDVQLNLQDPEELNRILNEYKNNIPKSRPIIISALYVARNHCEKYISTRDDFALLNAFRKEISYTSFQKKKTKKGYQLLSNKQKHQYERNPLKMNLFIITKYKNSGKLSSHNWFFNGFCQEIKCKYSVLLDVGLVPDSSALFRMYRHLRSNDDCGGVCGYMNLRIERLEEEDEEHIQGLDCFTRFCQKFVDIQRAQQVEYHFAHLIDKPFESTFRFIHVLPGAFSAYRMKALQPKEQQESKLLRNYFKALEESAREVRKVSFSKCKAFLKVLLPDFLFDCCYPPSEKLTQQNLLYDSNVFLAEDRTLCMGIHQNGFNLEYLPDAHAWVDPIRSLHSLLGQRKRWINGSFFAFEKVKRTMKKSKKCDFFLQIQIFYLNFINMLAFVSPSLFLLTIHIAMFAFRDWFFYEALSSLSYGKGFPDTEFYNAFVYVIDIVYVLLFLGFIFYSIHFTHRNRSFIPYIYGVSSILGVFSLIVFVVLFVDMIRGLMDSIICYQTLNKGGDECDLSFLSSNEVLRDKFFDKLPGRILIFTIYKWLVVVIVSLYIIPVTIYSIFYCRCQFLVDVICGIISSIFYTPTYTNILSTFALCRIDDISWGTKGLDAEDNRSKSLKETWKIIKILYVAKYIFWNSIVSSILIIVSNPLFYNQEYKQIYDPNNSLFEDRLVDSYVRKFFLIFALMSIIGLTLFFKIFLGAIYLLSYRCCKPSLKKVKRNNQTKTVDYSFKRIENNLMEGLKHSVHKIVDLEMREVDGTRNLKMKQKFSQILTSQILKGNLLCEKNINEEAKKKWNESYIMRKGSSINFSSLVTKKNENKNMEMEMQMKEEEEISSAKFPQSSRPLRPCKPRRANMN